MTIHVKVAGAWKEVLEPRIRPGSIGSFVIPISVHVKVAGVWKETWVASVPLSMNASPNISKFSIGCPHTSAQVFANATGGEPSYSYSWVWSAGGAGMSINNPTSSATTITQNGAGFRTGTLQCTVTDQAPNMVSDTVSVSMECGT